MSGSVVVGIPHPDKEKGHMGHICLELKNPKPNNILKVNKIKNDILEFLLRKIKRENMPVGGVHFEDIFPQTCCGKIDRSKLVKELVNKKH